MSASNVVLEHASLWVQIWGAPFDMMSLKVASDVGNKLGVVEDVEQRWRVDGQNFFVRVRVALPISKPLRRGGFLVGLEEDFHWVTYNYERLPICCHYCGLLRHDLWHCPKYFVALKNVQPIDYQYGDWLKAMSGWARLPPRHSDRSPLRSTTKVSDKNQANERHEGNVLEMVAAGATSPSNSQLHQVGSYGFGGTVPNFQASNSMDNCINNPTKESPFPKSLVSEDWFQIWMWDQIPRKKQTT